MSGKKKKNDIFQSELAVAEVLLWIGRPRQGIMFRMSDIFLIPFSLFWGGFAFLGTFAATADGGCFGLVGMPFVLAGIYFIVGRFYLDYLQRRHTYYAVTNDRAIILNDLFNRRIKTFNLRSLPDITLNLRSNGRGTISFESEPSWFSSHHNADQGWTPSMSLTSFEQIHDARWVYHCILDIQHKVQIRDIVEQLDTPGYF